MDKGCKSFTLGQTTARVVIRIHNHLPSVVNLRQGCLIFIDSKDPLVVRLLLRSRREKNLNFAYEKIKQKCYFVRCRCHRKGTVQLVEVFKDNFFIVLRKLLWYYVNCEIL